MGIGWIETSPKFTSNLKRSEFNADSQYTRALTQVVTLRRLPIATDSICKELTMTFHDDPKKLKAYAPESLNPYSETPGLP